MQDFYLTILCQIQQPMGTQQIIEIYHLIPLFIVTWIFLILMPRYLPLLRTMDEVFLTYLLHNATVWGILDFYAIKYELSWQSLVCLSLNYNHSHQSFNHLSRGEENDCLLALRKQISEAEMFLTIWANAEERVSSVMVTKRTELCGRRVTYVSSSQLTVALGHRYVSLNEPRVRRR